METVVSGIRSTGNLHLGNYYGAIQNFIKMQYEYNCYFFIADLHSLTTHPTPADLHANVKQVLVEYLAAGIDPEKATIYVQSHVPEVAELYLYLNMNAYLGELERATSFKDKVRAQPDNVNAGLLTYPVLMAADIIIHKATKVPVGKDSTWKWPAHLPIASTVCTTKNIFPNRMLSVSVRIWLRYRGLTAKEKWASQRVKAMLFSCQTRLKLFVKK
jgi:tryptophanyl-tRNA synthetase